MHGLELVFLLLAVCVALRVIAERFAVPYASALVVAGLGVALIPGLPTVRVPPEVIFLATLPPLLYGGAQTFPLRDLRHEAGAIMRLAVGLVLLSAAVAASVAHAVDPALAWPAAATLGAIVAATDTDAALWAMRAIPLARVVEAVLEGEGLLNDAAAVVAYRIAVAAAAGIALSVAHEAVAFVVRMIGGIVLGWIVAMLAMQAHRRTRSLPVVATTVSLLTPYAAFIVGERVADSGVIAVVVAGLYTARHIPQLLGPETRSYIRTMWAVVIFIVESLMFVLIGLELPNVMHTLDRPALLSLLRVAAVVVASLVAVRMVWVFIGAYVFRGAGQRLRGRRPPITPPSQVAFVAWAGLRGSDSLVLALSLPMATAAAQPFPSRNAIIFITFCVVVISLVVQGPTLAPLAERLCVFHDATDAREEAHARVVASEAALRALDNPGLVASTDRTLLRRLRRQSRQRARRWAGREQQLRVRHGSEAGHHVRPPRPEESALADKRRAELRHVRAAMLGAERRALFALRDRQEISDDVMRRVQRELDLEELLIGPAEKSD